MSDTLLVGIIATHRLAAINGRVKASRGFQALKIEKEYSKSGIGGGSHLMPSDLYARLCPYNKKKQLHEL